MRDFKYNDIYEDARIESILKERKHKIARQQVIFSAILLCILAVIGMYIIRHVVYTEFDGYLDTELNNIRAMEDLFIVDTYHDVGDAVMPGDTLFSYIHLSHFRGQENFNAEPGNHSPQQGHAGTV